MNPSTMLVALFLSTFPRRPSEESGRWRSLSDLLATDDEDEEEKEDRWKEKERKKITKIMKTPPGRRY